MGIVDMLSKLAWPPPKWQPYYINWDCNHGYVSVQAQMQKSLKEWPKLEEACAKALEEWWRGQDLQLVNNNKTEEK